LRGETAYDPEHDVLLTYRHNLYVLLLLLLLLMLLL
jgi:hypothetical protein